jgi:DNA-binding NarL/FixJ family response regulator
VALRVVVCDRLPIVRDGVATLLDAQPDIEVLDSTGSGIQALLAVRRGKPDVVVVGLALAGMSALELIRRLGEEPVDVPSRAVVRVPADDERALTDVLHVGATGVLVEDSTKEELASAVRAAARGQTTLAPQVAERLVAWFRRSDTRAEHALYSVLGALTAREQQVLVLLAHGMSTEEVANELVIGMTTVRTHVLRLCRKLNARDRTQLVSFAYRAGLMRSA